MKKEDLTSLGVTEEAIEKVLQLHTAELEKQKQLHTASKAELDTLKTQLKEANNQIEQFKGMDIEGIQKAAEEYKTKYEQAEQKAKADLEALQFDYTLSNALQGAKARNTKAVKALLDMESLTFKDGEILGLKEQLEKVKGENDYLFELEERVTEGTGFTKGKGNQEIDTSNMTYSQMLQYMEHNPNTTI